MTAPARHSSGLPSDVIVAAALLSREGTVVWWSRGAAELVGYTAGEVCGHPVRELLADARDGTLTRIPARGRFRLRHRSGAAVEVDFRTLSLEASREVLVLVSPTSEADDYRQDAALLRALFAQETAEIVLCDTDLRILGGDLPKRSATPDTDPPTGGRPREVMSSPEADVVAAVLCRVVDGGEAEIWTTQRIGAARQGRSFAASALRLEDAAGRPAGAAALFADVSHEQPSRHTPDVFRQASLRISGSLDVVRCAQELAEVLVTGFTDQVAVTLADAVLVGDEPLRALGGGELRMRRVAVAAASGTYPADLLQPGEPVPSMPDIRTLRLSQQGRTVVLTRDQAIAELRSPDLVSRYVPEDGHSAITAPLFARGLMLGLVIAWRTDRPDPFDENDRNLLTEVTSLAALAVDNARRYTRERRMVTALQQRPLPGNATDTPAAETAGIYRPAGGGANVRGDWFDVIPLPSFRSAFVVGDVAGYGLVATAAMARVRTAVQTLADLELPPEELLARVDDLVLRVASEASEVSTGSTHTVGATCLYAVYDPVARRCTLASAGHPPPILIRPDGTAEVVEITSGPPLGVGGMPFEVITLDLDPGSILALYTKGLVLSEEGLDSGMRRLVSALAEECRGERSLEDAGHAVAERIGCPPREDLVLLLARTHAVAPDRTADWTLPADPATVARAREEITRQLTLWGLDELAFTTELVVSELVTNAIRYAGGPIRMRLIRENTLVCEVTDPSNTQPRLRHARSTDEGGRGLFLVAQLTSRWGCRYGERGKTIWAEQPLVASPHRY